MRYLGGKHRIATRLAATIRAVTGPDAVWFEPFYGGLHMSLALGGPGLISDADPALIALYCAVRDGWVPPSDLSEAAYHDAKSLPDSDPLKAFAGFGCSFGGRWFEGYARDTAGHNFAAMCTRSLLRSVPELVRRGCEFACADFLRETPTDAFDFLYLDPPYRGTTEYRYPFDSSAFDRQLVRWARQADCFVSEYVCPVADAIYVVDAVCAVSRDKSTKRRTEVLFHRGPQDRWSLT